jgi:hypothetical protein
MPILSPKGMLPFPWEIIEQYRARALEYHGQSLERLAERGGLSAGEIVGIIDGLSYKEIHLLGNGPNAILRLAEIVTSHTP